MQIRKDKVNHWCLKTTPGTRKYHFEDWIKQADGYPIELVKGVDYSCQDRSMETACRGWATEHGLQVRVTKETGKVLAQFRVQGQDHWRGETA
jgi:hypothetical protein